jgi:hypothetical protein
LASLGTIGAFVVPGLLCLALDKVGKGLFALARRCLHRLRMKAVCHRDGS